MTRGEARVGLRVRDRATGRLGTVMATGTLSLGLVAVELDLDAGIGYSDRRCWLEIEDLEVCRDQPRARDSE